METENQTWIDSVLSNTPGYEAELFQRYAQRLIAFARTRLPSDVSSRVDEEDIVQSVFRSFFRRNQGNEFFYFDDSLDVWSLLAAMTYRKVINTIKHHHRDRRRTTREQSSSTSDGSSQLADRNPTPEELNILVDYLAWILNHLNPAQREIIQLRLEGYTVAEIADRVQLSQRTVKRALARARQLASDRIAADETQQFETS